MIHNVYQDIFSTAYSMSLCAGACIKAIRSQEELQLTLKNPRDLLTHADLASDTLIRSHIHSKYPTHQIISEESSPDIIKGALENNPTWIIDPIDGTVNYFHNQPQVAVSIGFFEHGVAQVGVVHAPFQGETFWAVRGGGAFLNGLPIRTSNARQLQESLVGTGFPYQRNKVALLTERVQKILSNCHDIRRIGSGALDICWVACGRLDAFYETLMPWDVAAARLIAREAGATIGHICDEAALSKEQRELPEELRCQELLVSNQYIFGLIRELLRS